MTAAKVYKVEPPDVTREMRDKAKTVNFGIIYGISAFGLQQRLNIPRKEAAGLIESYFEKYPGVRAYIDQTIEFAREHGYVQTLSGRRRFLRDINSQNFTLRSAAERLAMNTPIQGTAADLLKLAMIQVHRLLQAGQFQTRMLLTVHDEIVFDMLRSGTAASHAADRGGDEDSAANEGAAGRRNGRRAKLAGGTLRAGALRPRSEQGRPRQSGGTSVAPAHRLPSRQQRLDEATVDIGQSKTTSLVAKRQSLVINAQQVQDRGLQIMHVNRILHHVVAEIVGTAVADSRANATAGQPECEATGMMIAAESIGREFSLTVVGAAEFSAPND